jgi:catechol 2,3-dioxygenase-like lactoylglutathione lyase family enzyme
MSAVKVEDIAHVRFRAPDLNRMRVFLSDFGLTSNVAADGTLYARGRGGAPFLHATELGEAGFTGLAFRASSVADLEAFARLEKTDVKPLEAPGGGFVVRTVDPDGIAVELVAGQRFAPAEPFAPRVPSNDAESQTRFDQVKRVGSGPAHVVRLGHCVLNVTNFRDSERWYKDRFGLLTSDEVALSPEFAIGAFLRCDRGSLPSDHHTLFLVQSPNGPGFNHAAFEVRDFDDLAAGHDHLKAQGYQQKWGIGRHILGSQIFDYWCDPWGHTVEHWTDGDLVTAGFGPNKVGMQELLGVQWGPPAPPSMA